MKMNTLLFKNALLWRHKKYQWTAMPLAMYGTVAKTDGTQIEIALGDHFEDPIFMISDLLPHLDKLQAEKG